MSWVNSYLIFFFCLSSHFNLYVYVQKVFNNVLLPLFYFDCILFIEVQFVKQSRFSGIKNVLSDISFAKIRPDALQPLVFCWFFCQMGKIEEETLNLRQTSAFLPPFTISHTISIFYSTENGLCLIDILNSIGKISNFQVQESSLSSYW